MSNLRCYFASPFFNPEQTEREESLKRIIRAKGIDVFSPKEKLHLKPDSSIQERRAVFTCNLNEIVSSDFVFAITDQKDVGTIWECGFAYGMNIPVIYFCETLGAGVFNVMLAESGKTVFTKRIDVMKATVEDFEKYINIIGFGDIFLGGIE